MIFKIILIIVEIFILVLIMNQIFMIILIGLKKMLLLVFTKLFIVGWLMKNLMMI